MIRTILAVCCLAQLLGAQPAATTRRKIAIISIPGSGSGSHAVDGQRLADLNYVLFAERLGDQGVVIVEREMLNSVLKEQQVVFGEAFNDKDAVRLGQALQADALLVTRVTSVEVASMGKQKTNRWGGVLKRIPKVGSYGEIACPFLKCDEQVQVLQENVTVTVSARLISVETATGNVVTGKGGEQRQQSTSRERNGDGQQSRGDANALPRIALELAVKDASTSLTPHLAALPTAARNRPRKLMPGHLMVAHVHGNAIYFVNAKSSGVRSGDKVEVKRFGDPIVDPITGEIKGYVTTPVETATIQSVTEDTAEARSDAAPSNAKIQDVAVKLVVAQALPPVTATAPAPKPVTKPTPRVPATQQAKVAGN